ncbi:glycosyltransferase family 2 protein [Roseomonas fluvialis]|uniref:Glycosyl transferase n=1 Tax=Roseomonas fluvialis TaxID=1750527 RepID=A0ABN6P4P9_9PROT|nr:glycosyltransferase family 2 protein [Roseomonas fluvialis]BDG73481.1 glycosyl transferase [Roseomonas fluvialis]
MPPPDIGEHGRDARAVVLSVVIVTWNCRALVLDCLAALFASELPAQTEVIVVDNASADGTAAAVAVAFPEVLLIANHENAGFAAGNNLGFAVARGQTILLLNPDAFPAAPDSLMALWRFLEANAGYAAAGPRLLHEDGRHQVGDAGWRPGFISLALHALGLSQLLPRHLHGVFLVRPDRLGAGPVPVDWICGACMMVRADAVRQVGGLDANFFMYAEDVEWGCRMRRAGLRLGYLPQVRVRHLQGGTQVGRAAPTRWLDNLVRLHCSLNGPGALPLLRPILAAGFALRALAYGALAFLRGDRGRATQAATMWAFARHAWGLRPGGGAASPS